MGWNHGTTGWQAYDGFIFGVKVGGGVVKEGRVEGQNSDGYRACDIACTCFSPRQAIDNTCGQHHWLRKAKITFPDGRVCYAQEYLSVKDCDCDGQDFVSMAKWNEGEDVPEMITQICES